MAGFYTASPGRVICLLCLLGAATASAQEVVFADDFELGNTGGWSATIPGTDPCISSTLLAGDDFDDPSWEINAGTTFWQQASWLQNGTQMSVDRCEAVDGNLELTVLAGEPFQGGSIQTREKLWGYGRWDARLKPSAVPGVLNSMFTMDWDGEGSHEEVDIELLTSTFGASSGSIHFAIHETGFTNYFWEDVPLGFNPSDEFHLYSIEMLPDRINWYIDNHVVRTFFYDANVAFTHGYQFFFNAWTSETWINGPPAQDAVYQIDWVRFYPYICEQTP